MSRSNSIIPFHELRFLDDVPSLRSVEERFRKFLKRTRKAAQERAVAKGQMTEDDCLYDYELVPDEDTRRIKRRAMRVLERVHSSTGMYHLTEENRARLTPLRGGLPVSQVTSEHEADEIAAALHAEMPWMAPATEVVWQGLRASARDGLPGANRVDRVFCQRQARYPRSVSIPCRSSHDSASRRDGPAPIRHRLSECLAPWCRAFPRMLRHRLGSKAVS
ncbi:hypothetical protein [Tateyamaria sp. ANG-S1]|uniref:hypothetical protein n=1 Tax=Tateyamaria sp. ANG-S1 TaxID=1577905 RepID=UPI00187BD067|nr:hypothetical protein [Tateyamaria sp. ANG-S1]